MRNYQWFAAMRAHLPPWRRLWLGIAVVVIGSAAAIVAMHVDVVRVLSNPAVVIGGLILLGLHLFGGALVAFLAYAARKRRSRH